MRSVWSSSSVGSSPSCSAACRELRARPRRSASRRRHVGSGSDSIAAAKTSSSPCTAPTHRPEHASLTIPLLREHADDAPRPPPVLAERTPPPPPDARAARRGREPAPRTRRAASSPRVASGGRRARAASRGRAPASAALRPETGADPPGRRRPHPRVVRLELVAAAPASGVRTAERGALSSGACSATKSSTRMSFGCRRPLRAGPAQVRPSRFRSGSSPSTSSTSISLNLRPSLPCIEDVTTSSVTSATAALRPRPGRRSAGSGGSRPARARRAARGRSAACSRSVRRPDRPAERLELRARVTVARELQLPREMPFSTRRRSVMPARAERPRRSVVVGRGEDPQLGDPRLRVAAARTRRGVRASARAQGALHEAMLDPQDRRPCE